jgi:di/tricarboxylate transporter
MQYIKGIKLSTSAVSLMAIAFLLVGGVLTWAECMACTLAWDALFWLAIVMSMSKGLTENGVMGYFAGEGEQ